jgi:uncharacterized protein YutE (UPF0331/DUF86 family)
VTLTTIDEELSKLRAQVAVIDKALVLRSWGLDREEFRRVVREADAEKAPIVKRIDELKKARKGMEAGR